ncbi:MAG: hypothetical protein GY820_35925 [Gammaproteobacteria bacterium]|nr:hypothetical protein [Gammaproteobacteria bacterium]
MSQEPFRRIVCERRLFVNLPNRTAGLFAEVSCDESTGFNFCRFLLMIDEWLFISLTSCDTRVEIAELAVTGGVRLPRIYCDEQQDGRLR